MNRHIQRGEEEMKRKDVEKHAKNSLKKAVQDFERQFGVKAELTCNHGPCYDSDSDLTFLKAEYVIHGLSRIPAISPNVEGRFRYNDGFLTCYFDVFFDGKLISRTKKGKRWQEYRHLEGVYDPSTGKWKMRWVWY